MKIKPLPILVLYILLASCQSEEKHDSKPPNILLIVADDLGYTDLGVLGSEISTPHIDQLAKRGQLFTNFHTAPTCAPTRAMLLSGNDNHVAGMGDMYNITGEWGYEGHLTDRVNIIPEVLKNSGYHTYMTGKWHLGVEPENNPSRNGFEQSYTLLQGAGNHYDAQNLFNDTTSHYTFNGEPIEWEEGAYSTDVYTDKMLQFIDENKEDGKPFFGFLAYTTPHWPLQVDTSYWMKYKGMYDSGYEDLRKKRLQNLKNLGFVEDDVLLPPMHPKVLPWDSLTDQQKLREARKMELYAGMVTNLDDHMGQIHDYLESSGLSDNTYIIFMADNGAAAEDFYNDSIADESYHHPYFNNDFENMGQPDSYVSYGPQWAEAGTAAFKYYKEYATEGGTRVPMIIAGPGVTSDQSFTFASLLDIAPTIYSWAGASYPDELAASYPLLGASLEPVLSNARQVVHDSTYVFMLEQKGDVQVRKGNFKLVHSGFPILEQNFDLYQVESDISETTNMSDTYPKKRKELLALWKQYQEEKRIKTEESTD